MSKETRWIMWNEFDFTPGRLDRSPIAEHLGRSDQPWLDGIAWRQAGDHCVITFDGHNISYNKWYFING